MKKITILVAICLSSCMTVIAQTANKHVKAPVTTIKSSALDLRVDTLLTRVDSLLQVNNIWLEQIELDNSLKNRYKLYQTENIYTFLQLDTKTGQIEQVQWSLDSSNEGSVTINADDLTYGYGHGSNSFELYPTKNMYQFILLNKTSGQKWHVQWGMEDSKRWIRRIY